MPDSMPKSSADRIIAVDLTRILAAFFVMYEHLIYLPAPAQVRSLLTWSEMLIHRASPTFFLLAGYFVCRKITWKKALDNAFWCWAPFVLWNTVFIVFLCAQGSDILEKHGLVSLFGLTSLLHGYPPGGHPVNEPLWFMRDLIFLFLLSPILFRIAKYVLAGVIILAICPATAYLTSQNACIVVSLNSLGFFTLGCFVQSLGQETRKKILEGCSPLFLVAYATGMTAIHLCSKVWGVLPPVTEWGFAQDALGLLFLYQLARWLETHFPKLKPLILRAAPVTFLTFAGHLMVYYIMPDALKNGFIILSLPILTFAFFAAFFFLLKRIAPCLLHLVAHYKLRAEDLARKQAG